jgi:hypothetical protein
MCYRGPQQTGENSIGNAEMLAIFAAIRIMISQEHILDSRIATLLGAKATILQLQLKDNV